MSSGPTPIIWPMRLPVTRIRRCEQITALGAAAVPLVKMSAHGRSRSGLGVGVGVVDVRQRTLQGVAHHQHVVELVEHGGDQVVVSRLVDDQTAVGVADVVQQVGAAAGVVDPDHDGAGEGRTAEGEEVLGDVVEEDADVERAPGRCRARKRLAQRQDSR